MSTIDSQVAALTTSTNLLISAVTIQKNALDLAVSLATTQASLAVAKYQAFDIRYLGPKSSAPTTDNSGNPLQQGAMYYDTTLNTMFVWSSSQWSYISSQSTILSQTTILTAGQTVISTPTFLPNSNSVDVYVQGVHLLPGVDYSENGSGTGITLVVPAIAGSECFIKVFQAVGTGSAAAAAAAAAASATASAASATASAASATSSSNSATAAASSQTAIQLAVTQAVNAGNAATSSWVASTTPNETLAQIGGSIIHSGNVIKTFIYDTMRDSDGGQWRKKCNDKSWYSETLMGPWLGRASNELTARGDNLLISPDDLTNSNWLLSNASIGASSLNTASNDGSVIFQKAIESSATGLHQVYQTLTTSTVLGQTFATRVIFKKAERTKVSLFYSGTAFASIPQATIDLVAGTITPIQGAYGTIVADPISGGYIVTMYATTTANGTWTCGIGILNASGTASYAGDGTSGLYVSQPKVIIPGKLASTYSSSPELCTNGYFVGNSISGWTQSSSWGATAVAVNGEMQVTTTASSGRMILPLTCVVGNLYELTCTLRVISGTQAAIGISASTNGASINNVGYVLNTSTTAATFTVAFIATATTMYIAAGDNTAQSAGAINGFSGISIKQITTPVTPYVKYSSQTTSYYQNTTDNKFYMLNSTYGATEVFRGNVAQFPESVALVLETGRLVVYDLTQPNTPMWMSFVQSVTFASTAITTYGYNGSIYVGATNGLLQFNMLGDYIDFRQGGNYRTSAAITSRNNIVFVSKPSIINTYLVNNTVNDVSATVLPNAPIDPVFNLQIPTLSIATNGGVSIINPDNTIVNWLTNRGNIQSSYINKRGMIACTGGTSVSWSSFFKNSLPTTTPDNTFDYSFNASTIPPRQGTDSSTGGLSNLIDAGGTRVMASTQAAPIGGIVLLKDNPGTPTSGMVAYINNTYNTGWMVGDIRGNWLVDTVSEVLTASGELVVNGSSISSTSGWTAVNSSSLNAVSGELQVTSTSTYGSAGQSFSTIVGKTYRLIATYRNVSGGSPVYCSITDSTYTTDVVAMPTTTSSTAATNQLTFTATATTTYIALRQNISGNIGGFTNISCKLAIPDRSVKNNGMAVVGSVTKSSVATNANVQFFSGFSGTSSNYLEQSYNSLLDIGTGDFHIAAWENNPSATTQAYRFSRGTVGSSPTTAFYVTSDYLYRLYVGGVSISTGITQVAGIHKWDIVRTSGVLNFYLDGILVYSVANTASVTNTAALLRVGTDTNTAAAAGVPMAMFRMSATAPSSNQIAKMYADELTLFQSNSQSTIQGTSSVVYGASYDEILDQTNIVTPYGRTTFRGLEAISSEPTSTTTTVTVSGYQGARIYGGSSGAYYYAPPIMFREELKRRDELSRIAYSQVPVVFDFDSIASQTQFALPRGFTTKYVSQAGVQQREGSTKSFTRSYDGFQEYVNFAVAPSTGTWVSIIGIKL